MKRMLTSPVNSKILNTFCLCIITCFLTILISQPTLADTAKVDVTKTHAKGLNRYIIEILNDDIDNTNTDSLEAINIRDKDITSVTLSYEFTGEFSNDPYRGNIQSPPGWDPTTKAWDPWEFEKDDACLKRTITWKKGDGVAGVGSGDPLRGFSFVVKGNIKTLQIKTDYCISGTSDKCKFAYTEAFYLKDALTDENDTDFMEDTDGDNIPNKHDAHPYTSDWDVDGKKDGEDNCPENSNSDQLDSDDDYIGDACDPDPYNPDMDSDNIPDGIEILLYGTDPANWDTDGDGVSDYDEIYEGSDPINPLSTPEIPDDDLDNDLLGVVDEDIDCDFDNDEVLDIIDNCPIDYNPDQADDNEDGIGNACQSPTIRIEKTHDTYQGHYEYVSITIEDTELEMGGFDFLIGYDAAALAFAEAVPGQLLEPCEWEYFTYRHGFSGNCGDACPSGLMRIIAMAETNDGPNHPSCYGPPDTDPHELVKMKFLVSNDHTLNGQYVPMYFFWDDCGDNTVSSVDGEMLYVDRAVYDFEENLIWNEDDNDEFPEENRIPFVGAPDFCLDSDPDKPDAWRFIDFINGGIDIVYSDSIDDRGDINLNGTAYEIADAVTFTNYFIYGYSAFTFNIAGQTAATDINADGIVLTVGDLVYLINVIVNGWPPIPKLQPLDADIEASAALLVNHSAAAVSTDSPLKIGAGYFVLEHEGYTIGEPHLINGASDMTLRYNDQDGVLKVLVFSMEKDREIGSGPENIFVIPIEGEGTLRLVEARLADIRGRDLTARIADDPLLPVDFVLHQNYPNPFNAETQIIYELPHATRVTIDVINTMGQHVATLLDREETAGVHRATWNGADSDGNPVASGIYLYQFKSGDFIETKKMTLLK